MRFCVTCKNLKTEKKEDGYETKCLKKGYPNIAYWEDLKIYAMGRKFCSRFEWNGKYITESGFIR